MSNLTEKEFVVHLKKKTVIGHSGHRDLLKDDLERIMESVQNKLGEIVQGNPEDFVLITGIAEGADVLVVQAALKKGIKTILLTIDHLEYEQGDSQRIEAMVESHGDILVNTVSISDFGKFSEKSPYLCLKTLLVKYSDQLLLIWDGVVTGREGGISDVFHSFSDIERDSKPFFTKKENRIVHHLFISRAGNGVPSAHEYLGKMRLPRKGFDWETFSFDVTSSGVWSRKSRSVGEFWRNRFPDSKEIFVRAGIPVLLFLAVLLLGVVGYQSHYQKDPFLNSPFFAINLITMDASIFEEDYPWSLYAARFLGSFLAVYGFVLIIIFAIGLENWDRFKFRLYRDFRNKPFVVVIGSGEFALDIIKDIASSTSAHQKDQRVVVLQTEENGQWARSARLEKAWIVSGKSTDPVSLKKTHFHKANKVYVVNGLEEDNVMAVMEMDRMLKDFQKYKAEDWYVHVYDKGLKTLLQQSISAKTNYSLTVFSHAENTARKMIASFPEIRMPKSTNQDLLVVIFGFNDLGKELLIKSIQQYIYNGTRKINIIVYHTVEEHQFVANFKNEYPYLFNQTSKETPNIAIAEDVIDWTFYQSHYKSDRVTFQEIHQKSQPTLYEGGELYNGIYASAKTKVYVCHLSGLQNASLLNILLPVLELMKIKRPVLAIETYCFSNFPDMREEVYLERKLNALAPLVPVKNFGNFLEEFSSQAIENKEADHLAKQIALWYYLLYDFGSGPKSVRRSLDIEKRFAQTITRVFELQNGFLVGINKGSYSDVLNSKIEGLKQLWYAALSDVVLMDDMQAMMRYCWKNLSETDREGNRQAADHLWVKLDEFDKSWKLSEEASHIQDFRDFWTKKEIEDLGVVEHRRWNTMKILDGWRSFEGSDWKKYKENYKAQKLHNLLVPFGKLPTDEQVKDFHQIEGIPYFIALFYKDQYQKNISFDDSIGI